MIYQGGIQQRQSGNLSSIIYDCCYYNNTRLGYFFFFCIIVLVFSLKNITWLSKCTNIVRQGNANSDKSFEKSLRECDVIFISLVSFSVQHFSHCKLL